MWVFGTTGFVSAVQHRERHDRVLVRARDRKALESLIDNIELAGAAEGEDGRTIEKVTDEDIVVLDAKDADYRYRVEMAKATFALAVQHEILNFLDYDNFKNALQATRGEVYHDAAMDVWLAMHQVDDTRPAARKRKTYKGAGTRAGAWL